MKIRGIARDLLKALLSSAREVDNEGGGREFVAVLREEEGVIREFLFPYYRQLLTNLGVATDAGLAQELLSPQRFAPMRDVNVWQVLQQAVPIPADATKDNALPGLAHSVRHARLGRRGR